MLHGSLHGCLPQICKNNVMECIISNPMNLNLQYKDVR
jgi:hypothetical protein